jgi:hypothetical protein
MKKISLLLFAFAGMLFGAGCRPASSPPTASSAAPKAPAGVTSRTEQALDSQPAVGSVRATIERDKGLVDLNQIALFYANDQADGGQVRESVIKDLQKNMPKAYQAVQQGDYILLSGDPGRAPAGASHTIVAYTREAPTRGGVAAFLDGHTRNLTAQEFQAAAQLGK